MMMKINIQLKRLTNSKKQQLIEIIKILHASVKQKKALLDKIKKQQQLGVVQTQTIQIQIIIAE
jgi:heme exporter protein D